MSSSPSIPLRTLGKNGPSVPALGLGLMGLSHGTYGSSLSHEEAFAILDRAFEIGARFWDTSDLYGDSEEMLGKWFKRTGKRDQIFLASKFGYVKGKGKTLETDTSGPYTKKACEESLRLLGVDSIDLYYVHNVNRNTPIEETMRALAELQAEGKIKHIGLSMVSGATVRRAVKIAPVVAVQAGYSLFSRDIESSVGTDLLAVCRDLGIAIVAATPLDRGLLTSTFSDGKAIGDATDMRPKFMPRFTDEYKDRNVEIVSQFREVAKEKGCTVSQLAIAWLLKQGDDIIPIPGTKQIKYLEENWGALNVTLTDEDEAKIRKFIEATPPAGPHTPAAYMPLLYQDTVEESK